MDTLFKIIAIGLITCFATLIVKPVRSDFAILIGVVGGLLILAFLMGYLSDVFAVFNQIMNKTGISQDLFSIILKIVGIGYLTEFAASICSDTGNSGLADKLLLGGKVIILVLALPIIMQILDIVAGILP